MSHSEAQNFLRSLDPEVAAVAQAAHEVLVDHGCQSYVKTIYIGYDIGGSMVAALYARSDHVEVALALPEDHSDQRLVDASHLTWRTLPLALNLDSVGSVAETRLLFEEACARVASQAHDVHRDNEYFIARKRGQRIRPK